MTQVGGKLVEGNPKSKAGRRSVPIPERLMPALKARLDACPPGAPAITSPQGSRLSLENWKRAVNWRKSAIEIDRAGLRVHDLRPTSSHGKPAAVRISRGQREGHRPTRPSTSGAELRGGV